MDIKVDYFYIYNNKDLMKKIIFTETQIKKAINSLISEGNNSRSYDDVLKIQDLAEIISRLGGMYEYNTMLTLFQEAFRDGGDEDVKTLFKIATKTELDNIGRGRYMIKF